MTLTSIMPSLRRTLPAPLSADSWPEHTHATTTDVVVSGISMLRLADLCETPCVHTGDAVIPGTHGRRAPGQDAAVVVVKVTAVLKNWDADRVVLIDACLDSVPALWGEARLIGRASTAHDASAVVLSGESHHNTGEGRAALELPADLHEGDLLAIPCRGMVVMRDVRAQRSAVDTDHTQGATGAAWLTRLE